ncbi:MAG: twin transmembrane helix small protein, partial [Burkholderiales bacterium]
MLNWSHEQGAVTGGRRHYMDVVTIIVILGMLATVWALLRGITSMVQGGEADFRQSHKLMFQRVGLQ